jgi:hypothetical protein
MKKEEIKEMIEALQNDKESIETAIDAYNDISWQSIVEPHNVMSEMEAVLSDIVLKLEGIEDRLELV